MFLARLVFRKDPGAILLVPREQRSIASAEGVVEIDHRWTIAIERCRGAIQAAVSVGDEKEWPIVLVLNSDGRWVVDDRRN